MRSVSQQETRKLPPNGKDDKSHLPGDTIQGDQFFQSNKDEPIDLASVDDGRRPIEPNKASEPALAVEAEAMAKLNALGSRLWRMQSLREGINEMLLGTIEMLGADFGNVQLLEDDKLRIASQSGFKEDFLEFFREVSTKGDCASGRALRSGERIIIEDIEVDEGYAPMRDVARSAGYRAIQSTPLIGRDGKPHGMISTHWRSPHQPDEKQLRHLDLYVQQAINFIERCKVEQNLRESEERLQKQSAQREQDLADSKLLQEISATLIEEDNVEALYAKMVDAAVAIMQADFACMQMFRPERGSGELHLLAQRGFGPEIAKTWEWVGHKTLSSCGAALRQQKRVVATDLEQCEFLDAEEMATYRAAGIVSMQSTPLHARNGKLVGMISTHWRRTHKPSERELRLFDILARQVAEIIERHRTEDALHKRGERFQLLSETLGQLLSARDPDIIVRELFPKVAAHLGVDTYFNFMVNPAEDALTLHSCAGIPEETACQIRRLEFGQAICGTVAQTRKPIHATDIQHSDYDKAALVRGFGIQCYACNPLMAGDRLLGTLSFASRRRTTFDPDELQFLEIISQYTAVALDRLRQSEKLRESEERFRALLDNSPAVIYVKDCDGKHLLINKHYEKLFHTRLEDIVGKTDLEVFPKEIARKFRENDLRVIRTGKPLEVEEVAPHHDGPHIYLSIKFPLRRADGGIYAVAGISTDITDRKRAQIAVERLAAIVECSDDAIMSKDMNGVITSWNKGAERVFGYTAEEVIGKPGTILMPPDRVNEEPNLLEQLRRGERVDHYQTIRRRKDGTLLDISLTISPIKDADGKVIGASKVARDISELVRAKEKLEETVAQRTASLREAVEQMEEFSYSVSHDLRAPLRAMNAYAAVLLADYSERLDETGRGYLEKIRRSSDRMDRLTRDVLAYSRVARLQVQPEVISLERLVRDVISQHTSLQSPLAEIGVVHHLPDVLGHEATLGQVVSNLLNNSVKFVAAGVKPRVSIRTELREKKVRVWFEDNGIGIKPQYHERIFQMFERVHPDGKYEGTGIGLTIVRKAIEKMGGRIGVESDGENGSQFWIELPVAE